MNITNVKLHRISDNKCLALATITIDNDFAVHGFKVFNGKKGLFVSSPSKKDADGEYRDTAHPITTEAYHQLQTAVLNAYNSTEPHMEPVSEREKIVVQEEDLPF